MTLLDSFLRTFLPSNHRSSAFLSNLFVCTLDRVRSFLSLRASALRVLLALLELKLLLLLDELILLHSLNEFVGVRHDLGDQMVLVVIFQVVDLFEVLVVLPRDPLYIRYQILVLQIQPPILPVVVSPCHVRGGWRLLLII